MNLQDYQPLARRTMKELPTYREHMEHMTLGVNGELGEIADALKKFLIYGKGVDPATREPKKVEDGGKLDFVNLAEEGGDGWWYIVGFVPEVMGGRTSEGISYLQKGFDDGYAADTSDRSSVTLLTQIQAQVANATLGLLTDEPPSEGVAQHTLMILGRNMGYYYRMFGLDLSDSLETNIAKLAKRYGDKYSDYAALNRDLKGEREVLESGGDKKAK